MVSVISTEVAMFRAFGWVQDPSNLRSLCNVTAVFDENSIVHEMVRNERIPSLVNIQDGRDELIAILDRRPLKIEYTKLVGTTTVPRSEARCNAIIQATVQGQTREFIGDWPADNFVRWAHAFGFISYNYEDDTFQITKEGRRLVAARPASVGYPNSSKDEYLSEEEILVLTEAILAYPPAIRILRLLSEKENTHLTKFEIGSKLGFLGEDGFASLPQTILLRSLAATTEHKERSKMRMDWDGSSDKYARMIGKWLTKLELIEQKPKYFDVSYNHEIKKEMIGQSFMITAKGYMALGRCDGKSKHRRIPKNVCFEMFSVRGNDREFLRTRRALLLKYFMDVKAEATLSELKEYLEEYQIHASIETINDDLQGLISIGIMFREKKDYYIFEDVVNDFTIPIPRVQIRCTDQEEKKEALRKELLHVPHEYLSLLDLAYDSKQNRLFEMKTMQLLTDICGFEGSHLGGSRKPDGILYTPETCNSKYGVLVDTKAYSKGYNLPITQADEMERYLLENQMRNAEINPNEWWSEFPTDYTKFHYLFIAGHFKGNYEAQLKRISHNKNVTGGVISVETLLRLAEYIKREDISLESLEFSLFCNNEIDVNSVCSKNNDKK